MNIQAALLLADKSILCSWMPVSCCAGRLPCLCRIAVDKGLFVDLADKMANAVQNLQPKLNIWTTGTAGLIFFSGGSPPFRALSKLNMAA